MKASNRKAKTKMKTKREPRFKKYKNEQERSLNFKIKNGELCGGIAAVSFTANTVVPNPLKRKRIISFIVWMDPEPLSA